MLKRFWELIDEVAEFMRGKKKAADVACLTDKAWQADLTFLVDVTEHLNGLNMQL